MLFCSFNYQYTSQGSFKKCAWAVKNFCSCFHIWFVSICYAEILYCGCRSYLWKGGRSVWSVLSSVGSHPSQSAEGGQRMVWLGHRQGPHVPSLLGSDIIKLWWLPSFLVYLVSEASCHHWEPSWKCHQHWTSHSPFFVLPVPSPPTNSFPRPLWSWC